MLAEYTKVNHDRGLLYLYFGPSENVWLIFTPFRYGVNTENMPAEIAPTLPSPAGGEGKR
jgi:hypothetical protein